MGGNPDEEVFERGCDSETDDEDVRPEYGYEDNALNQAVVFDASYVRPASTADADFE